MAVLAPGRISVKVYSIINLYFTYTHVHIPVHTYTIYSHSLVYFMHCFDR